MSEQVVNLKVVEVPATETSLNNSEDSGQCPNNINVHNVCNLPLSPTFTNQLCFYLIEILHYYKHINLILNYPC